MKTATRLALAVFVAINAQAYAQTNSSGAEKRAPIPANKTITEADCSASKLGTSISVSATGEPVSAVTLDAMVRHPANRLQ